MRAATVTAMVRDQSPLDSQIEKLKTDLRIAKMQADELMHNGIPHAKKVELQRAAAQEVFRVVLEITRSESAKERSFGDPEKETVYCLAIDTIREAVLNAQNEMSAV